MLKKLTAKRIEIFFFYAFLLISALSVILNKYNPSLDGPSHLYYSHLINYLLSGNEFINNHFALNKIPAPNLTDHYLLALFNLVLPFTVSQKLLLLIFVVGFPLSIRFVIKLVNPASICLSAFAIVFSQSFLYYLGFYNFCLSFVFLFAAIGVYFKYFSDETRQVTTKGYILLFIFITLTYFTNGLAFGYLAVILFLYELSTWYTVLRNKHESSDKKKLLIRILIFSLLWIPSAACFYLFIKGVPMQASGEKKSFAELWQWICDVSPLVVYGDFEHPYTRKFLQLLGILLLTVLYFRFRNRTILRFLKDDIFLLVTIGTIAAYFFIPSGTSVGMMSERLCFYMFIFLIVWMALQKTGGKLILLISIAALFTQAVFLIKVHMPIISDLNKAVEVIRSSGEHIEPNSVVLPVDISDNWLFFHVSDYIGVDKPLAIVEGYAEGSAGWFAVNWNWDKMPKLLLGDSVSNVSVSWANNPNSKTVEQIEYIFIHGDFTQIGEQKWVGLKSVIDTKYKLVYTSPDERVHLYRIIL